MSNISTNRIDLVIIDHQKRLTALEEKVEKLELWKINNLNSEQLKDLKGKINELWERNPFTGRSILENQNKIEALEGQLEIDRKTWERTGTAYIGIEDRLTAMEGRLTNKKGEDFLVIIDRCLTMQGEMNINISKMLESLGKRIEALEALLLKYLTGQLPRDEIIKQLEGK